MHRRALERTASLTDYIHLLQDTGTDLPVEHAACAHFLLDFLPENDLANVELLDTTQGKEPIGKHGSVVSELVNVRKSPNTFVVAAVRQRGHHVE